jgi:hypothetical protein
MESGRPAQGGQTWDSATLAAGGIAVAGNQVPAITVPLPRIQDEPEFTSEPASKSRLRRVLRSATLAAAVVLGGLVLGLLAGLLSGIL